MAPDRRFLDTTVARALLTGSAAYRQYLRGEVGPGPLLISNYVVMEFRRGFLNHLIEFYAWVDLPTHRTFGDALASWTNQWGGRLKAVSLLVAWLSDTQNLEGGRPEDKSKALVAIARLIKRYERKLRTEFEHIETDSTRCGRADVPMKMSLETVRDDFARFMGRFNDTQACRNRCRIDDFLLKRYQREVESFAEDGAKVSKNDRGRGFAKIGEQLREIIAPEGKSCTCAKCGKIGDVVIALDAPRNAMLETTDYSFDYLCPPIAQPHQRHQGELAFVRSGPEAATSASPAAAADPAPVAKSRQGALSGSRQPPRD